MKVHPVGVSPTEPFTQPVGIWSVGYKFSREDAKSLWGKTVIEPEPSARFVYEKAAEELANTTLDEREMLNKFIGELKAFEAKHGIKPTLVGYNVASYDAPLLYKRMVELGFAEEDLSFVRSIQVEDVREMAEEVVRKAAAPYEDILKQVGVELEPGRPIQGTKLKHVAAGFGIKAGDVHKAKEDVDLVAKVYDKLRSGAKFDVGEWQRSVERERRQLALPSEARVDEELIGQPRQKYKKIIAIEKGEQKRALDIAIEKQQGPPVRPRKIEPNPKSMQDLIEPLPKAHTSKGTKEESWRAAYDMEYNIKEEFSKAKEKMKGAADEATESVKNLADILKSSKIRKYAIFGGAIFGAAYIYRKTQKHEGIPNSQMLDASSLGMSDQELARTVSNSGSVKRFNEMARAHYDATAAGTAIHKKIEEEFSELDEFVGSEVYVEDQNLGIKGYIDILIESEGQKTPIEIKTIDDDKIDALVEAKPEHAAQANFYAHAVKSPGAYILYVSREDLSKRKSFYVPYDPGSLLEKVYRTRSAIIENLVVPKGIRQPMSAVSAWYGDDRMKPHSDYDFPAGRAQMFCKKFPKYCNFTKCGTRDQLNRHNFAGVGFRRTPVRGNYTVNGSRHLRCNK
ncbi:MAG: hypothetical protein D6710_12000 [Nitrospirae bacterium]|nr:MAG: hypothetical protein D6710_12000 [Nitrospirota bacterium]